MNEVFQPEGNFFDKYGSTNPIVKWLMRGFFSAMDELLELSELKKEGAFWRRDAVKEM